MTHKDTNNTAGMRTTQGSLALRDFIPDADDLIVARLKAAGVVTTGKTNVPEFGLGSNTYNNVFGPTLNAFDPALTAGGSSGGAAVALALDMVPVADGSDFGGSLRNPAAWNNVYGFRPSQGLVPGGPDVEVFHAQMGVDGPMGRNVRDMALLLDVQAGCRGTSLAPSSKAWQRRQRAAASLGSAISTVICRSKPASSTCARPVSGASLRHPS
jgi:amidase